MKKQLLLIVFFVFAGWMYGQCGDINDFTLSSMPSDCFSNGRITVNAPGTTSCTKVYNVVLTSPKGAVTFASLAAGQSYTFMNLQPTIGTEKYTVELHDADGTESSPKTIQVVDSYVKFQLDNAALSNCGSNLVNEGGVVVDKEDGRIGFKINPNVGNATKFEVYLEDENGNKLVENRFYTRSNPSVTLHGLLTPTLSTDRIPSNTKVYLKIREVVTGRPADCRPFETFEVQMHPAQYGPGTFDIKIAEIRLRLQPGGQYQMLIFPQRKHDGKHFHEGNRCNHDKIKAYYRFDDSTLLGTGSTATATIQNHTKGTPPQPIGSSFDYWSYRYTGDFDEGDDVEIIIDDGKGHRIERRFTLSNLIDLPTHHPTNYTLRVVSTAPCLPSFNGALKIASNVSVIGKNYINTLDGESFLINYQWFHNFDRNDWPSKYGYKVYKSTTNTNANYALLTPGTDYVVEDFNLIDVTPSGEGWYKVRIEALDGGGKVTPYHEKTIRVVHSTVDRFDVIFNQIQSRRNYGVAEGTVSFDFDIGLSSLYYTTSGTFSETLNQAKLVIDAKNPSDRVQTFATSLPLGGTRTVTITFPKELPLVPPTPQSPNGSGTAGLGDFLPGEYVLTLTDACGTKSRTFVFDNAMNFGNSNEWGGRPQFRVVPTGCNTYKIEIEHGTLPYAAINMNTSLDIKQSNGIWRSIRNVVGKTGTFEGLLPGEYRLRTYNHLYLRENKINAASAVWTLLPPYAQAVLTGKDANSNINRFAHNLINRYETSRNHVYDDISLFTIETPVMRPYVSSISCDGTNGSGLVSVDVSENNGIVGDLTYVLTQVVGTIEQEVASVTVSSTQQDHVFTNLQDGNYFVLVKDQCREYKLPIQVDSSAAFSSPTVQTPQNICKGSVANMSISVSPSLFDIDWYRINPVTGTREGPIAQNVKRYSEAVVSQTTYEVGIKLKSKYGCVATTSTYSGTVTILTDTTPPVILTFPADKNLSVSLDKCKAEGVTWDEPTYTDSCTVTVSQTHHSPYNFPIGVHSVVYTFTDPYGNTTSRTMIVTVQDRQLGLSLSNRYTNGGVSASALSTLVADQIFFYEVRYKNTGVVPISEGKLKVYLSQNSNVIPANPSVQSIDLSEAGGAVSYTYDAVNKVYTFTIPGATFQNPTQERVIKIPLQLTGGQQEAGKPCMNFLITQAEMVYKGGTSGCEQRTQTATTDETIEINTSSNERTEIFCLGNPKALTAQTGFSNYVWYDELGNVLQNGTQNTYTPLNSGTYKVEKSISCAHPSGVNQTILSYEIINYQEPGNTSNPIKAQANNLGVLCANDNKTWTSHFYLCDGNSKVISVNFVNTQLIWQKLKESTESACQPRHETCPVLSSTSESCWETVATDVNTFTLTTAGRYRLKAKGNSCEENYYFDVFTQGISGTVVNYGHKTNYFDGYINVRMATQDVNYNFRLKDSSGADVAGQATTTTSRQHRYEGLDAGTYTVWVNSPDINGGSCVYIKEVTIDMQATMFLKAQFIAWTDCNKAKIRFEAGGGNPPYQFAIWSVDGHKPYSSHLHIPASDWVGDQGQFDSYFETEMDITQVGEYEFVVRDQNTGAYAISNKLLIEPEGEHKFSIDVTHLQCPSASPIGEIRLRFDEPTLLRVANLYQLDASGNRVSHVGTQTNTIIFQNLNEGSYELDFTTTIGTKVCRFIKKPIMIYPAQNPLRAYAGIIADKSCTLSGKYRVAINNVSGGSGTYQYSFNGEHGSYTNNSVGEIDGTDTVFVKDSSGGCVLPLQIVVIPPIEPQLLVSTPSYRCNGIGTVTVTASSTVSQTYTYSVGTETPTTNNVFGLSPGTHVLHVHYVPAGTTQNNLFEEDFGVGEDICATDLGYADINGNSLICVKEQALSEGNYAITKQVYANSNWILPPSDASGVLNGRYLAVMTNAAGVVYKKQIRNIVPNSALHFEVEFLNLVASVSAPKPFIEVDLVDPVTGTVLATKNIGTLTDATWKKHEITFLDSEVASHNNANGFNILQLVVRNTLSTSGLGNDFAIDNIKVWQSIKFCNTSVSRPINIEDKKLRLQLMSATPVSCHGGNDGKIKVKVHNRPAQGQYSLDQNTWSPVVFDANDEFEVAGLSATWSGTTTVSRTIYFQDVADASCQVEVSYVISQPTNPISLSPVLPIAPVRCDSGITTVTFEAVGGNNSYSHFTYQSTTMTTPALVGVYNGKYSEPMGLAPGIYTVTVQDVKGCSTETVIEIKKQDLRIEAEIQGFNPNCYDGINGKDVQVNVLSGNGTYEFKRSGENQWYGGGMSTYLFSGLRAGTHTFTVRDIAGCETSTTVTIYEPLALTVSQTTVRDCNGTNTSTFVLTVVGGSPDEKTFVVYRNGTVYTQTTQTASTYVFQTPDRGVQFNFLVQQTYANGTVCESSYSRTYRVVAPPRFKSDANFAPQPAYCTNNGRIETDIAQLVDQRYGQVPYTVEVYADGGGGIPTGIALIPTTLAGGDYVVVLTDALNCKATRTVTVDTISTVSVTVETTPISCGVLSTASITLTTGGHALSEFRVIVSDLSGTTDIYTTTLTRAQLPHNLQISNLNFGDYRVVVEDIRFSGCQQVIPFQVGLAPDLLVTMTPTTTTIGCSGLAAGSITVRSYETVGNPLASSGIYVGIYSSTIASITPPNPLVWHEFPAPQPGFSPVTGLPTQYVEHTFTGLIPGAWYEYIVYSKDASGNPCMFIGGGVTAGQIPVPTQSTLSMTTTTTGITCSTSTDGKVLFAVGNWATATTQIDYHVYTYPDYALVSSKSGTLNLATSNTGEVSGLNPGRYVLVFEENNGGCVNATKPFVISGFPELLFRKAEVTKPSANCTQRGEITVLEVVGGLAPYTYMAREITNTVAPTLADFANPTATDYLANFGSNIVSVPAGTYTLWVKDSAGCIRKREYSSFTILPEPEPAITSVTVDVCNPRNNRYNVVVNTSFSNAALFYYYQLEGDLMPTPVSTAGFIIPELESGVYTITFFDSNNCGGTYTFTVGTPVRFDSVSVVQGLTCATPTAQVQWENISGGTHTYTYQLMQVESEDLGNPNQYFVDGYYYIPIGSETTINIPSGTATTVVTSLTGLPAGQYVFRLRDSAMKARNCHHLYSNRFTIEPPKVPEEHSIVKLDATCSGSAQGSISIVARPASIEPIQFTIVSVKDLATGVSTATSVAPHAALLNTASFRDLVGTASGTEYTIKMQASNGCESLTTSVLYAPLPIQVATGALKSTPFTCSMSSALTASLSFDASQVSGGIAPYTWEFIDSSSGNVLAENVSEIFISNISGGNYYVRVTDSSGGCYTTTASVTIAPAFTLSNVGVNVKKAITCATNEEVEVNVLATPHYIPGTEVRFIATHLGDGSVISEVYTSTVTTTTISHTFATLFKAGDYEITVENVATGCGRAQATHKVADLSDKFEVLFTNERQPSCYQGNDGQIEFTFVDRKPTIGGDQAANGFTYTVTNMSSGDTFTGVVVVGSSTALLSGMKEGVYRFEAISSANQCRVQTYFTIPPTAPQMVVQASPVPTPEVSCLTNKGSILVGVTGGKAPYSITLTSALTTVTQVANGNSVLFNHLEVGVYTVTLTDAWGCTSFTGTQVAELLNPKPLTASITVENVRCKGEANGRVIITNMQGGSGSTIFSFELDNGIDPKIVQTSNVVENLKPGTYSLHIIDGLGCATVTTVTIKEPDYVEASIDTAGSDRLVCYGESDGFVAVKAKGGVQPYAVDVYESVSGRKITPVSYTSPAPADPSLAPEVLVITNAILEPGTYYALVTDANGCATKTLDFTIEELPNIAPREAYQERVCQENTFSDAIVVRFHNSIDFTNATYSLQTASGVTTGVFSQTQTIAQQGYIYTYDRTSATQTLTVFYTQTHADGTQSEQCQQSYVITDIQDIKALTVTEVTNTTLNAVEVQVTGGVAPYTYYFNGSNQGDNSVYIMKLADPGYVDTETKQIIKEVQIEVVDALGCSYTLTIERVFYDITIPNFFTPDGDGFNDTWKPKNIENHTKARVHVFDRHGRKMRTLTPFDSWNGTYENKNMPSGDYWYILELNDLKDRRKFFGNFTLYR